MKIKLTLLAFVISLSLFTQINPKINTVKVFTEGAEIYREKNIKIELGLDTLKIEGLSPFVSPQTIQAKLQGAKILDLNFRINHLKSKKDQPRLMKIKNQIRDIEKDLLNLTDQLSYLEIEKDLILSNKKIRGEDPLDIEDIKDFVNYYQSKMPELLSKITDTHQQINKFESVKRKLINQEREIEKVKSKRTGEVEILYQSDKSKTTKFEISYHVSRCGWKPLYAMRASNIDAPINFEYNALVYQNTGTDWEDCKLTVASGNPILNGEKPELYPWRLKIQIASQENFLMNSSLYTDKSKLQEKKEISDFSMKSLEKKRDVIQTENLTFTSFKIPQKFSLNSGQKDKRISILKKTLPASFHYYAVPKKSSEVHLVANVTNLGDLALIPGQSHIYFDGTFVGKSFLNPTIMNDTLTISLGQDQSILTERIKQEDKCLNNVNLLGVTKKRAYDITVKNNRNKAIRIEIMDQIPISKNNKIKVSYKLGQGWVLKEETGILKWDLIIPPGDKVSSSLEFEVKHPKKYNVPL
jgi:uncharacterized protein (TIGR02231 family)